MAKKEIIICKNIYKSVDTKTLKDEYLVKWVELINIQEKCKDCKPVLNHVK